MHVSRKLKYRFNKVYRWEAGSARMSWSDFIKYAKACRAPVEAALEQFDRYKGAPDDAASLLAWLVSEDDEREVAQRLAVPVSRLREWKRGSRNPRIDDLIAVLPVIAGPAWIHFVKRLCGDQLPLELQTAYLRQRKFEDKLAARPWLLPLWEVMISGGGRNETRAQCIGRMGRLIKWRRSDLEDGLDALFDVGIARMVRGRVEVLDFPCEISESYRAKAAVDAAHFTLAARFVTSLSERPNVSRFASGWFLCDADSLQKIQEILMHARRRIMRIAVAPSTGDQRHLMMLGMALLDAGESGTR